MNDQLKGVIFDVDGTLVASNDAHAEAWVDAFATFGYDDVSFDRVRPLIGMGGDRLIPQVVPGLSDEENPGKEIARYRQKLFLNSYAQQLSPTKGARELVIKIKEAGLKAIVASSAKKEELSILLKAARVDDLLPEATTADDAEESKPSPDIVRAALNKQDLPPDRVVMLGDTPYDIKAAKAAGVGVIALRCGGWQDDRLAEALAIYDDPADLLAHYADSPLGQAESK
ncbi:MAG: HAD family hydrolase [Cyanosarcina radialis HA8281-LM2]|nr:HAD family hydrolase [Cyanosarcina radialis HA8281-LM2]